MKTRVQMAGACLAAMVASMLPMAYAQQPTPKPQPAPRTRVIVTRSGGSYLGIGVVDIDSERAKALNMKEERGVEVKTITKDGPAAKAGIKEGDVVLDYNGTAVQGIEQFQRLVRETPAGREVKLNIWRGGAAQTLSATIAQRPGGTWVDSGDHEFSFHMPEIPAIPQVPVMPDMPRFEMSWRNTTLGIEGESLSTQLAEYFGVKEGVLVRSVVKNSAAEKSGLKAGDVIVKVDDTHVTNPREITAALRANRTKTSFPVVVVRNHKEMTITVTMPERVGETRTRARAPRPVRFVVARV